MAHDFRPRRWVTGIVAGLAAAAALVVAVRLVRPMWVDSLFDSRGTRPELRELIAALANEPTRPVEGRLTGGFKYAPPPPAATRGRGEREASPDVRIAAAKIEKLVREKDTAQDHAALAVAYLSLGQPEEAVQALEDAASENAGNAAVLSDLAAAYLARARFSSRSEDFASALAAAERSIKANPNLDEPWFNRALSLDALHLSVTARDAWQAYIRRDGVSGWATEARTRSVERPQSKRSDPFRSHETVFSAAATPQTLHSAVDRFPQAAREYVEDQLLPAWAAALQEGRTADAQHLQRLGVILGDRLGAREGDWLARDAITVLVNAPPAQVAVLSDAHVRLESALAAYAQFQLDKASPLFATAAEGFKQGPSPFRWRAALGSAIVSYYGRDLRSSEFQLHDLALAVDERRYPTLAAQIARLSGLIDVDSGRFDRALTRYESAVAMYERAAEPENAASVRSLMTDVMRTLGRSREAWDNQVAALAFLDSLSKPRNQESMLLVSALMASERGLDEVSLHFEDAALRIAMEFDGPAARAQVLVRRSGTLARLDRHAAARDDLDQANRWLSDLTDANVKRRLQSEIMQVHSTLVQRDNPTEAIRALTVTADFISKSTIVEWFPSVYLGRGRAYAAIHDLPKAIDDFETGIRVFERHRRQLRDEQLQISYFDEAWGLYDELIALRIRTGTPWQALAAAEEGRARVMADDVPPVIGPAGETCWRDVPSGVAGLEFVVLKDRTFVWVVTARGVRHIEVPVRKSDLHRDVRRLRAEILNGEARPRTARRLFDLLIGPMIADVPAEAALLIVPDSVLHEVPFPALLNPSGRFLAEDHPVSLAQSLRGLRELRSQRLRIERATPFVIGSAKTMSLDALDAVTDEVEGVKKLFPAATVALGNDATSTRFLKEISQHDVIHFAGHAVANPDRPGLSRLAFAPSADGNGDLFVTALSGLRLPRTKLVVLAACETATGWVSRSEGVMSLARPFLRAGAQSVVATLWPVEDRATAVFVRTFYEELRERGEVAEALRMAQVRSIRDATSESRPRHWASFVHIAAHVGSPKGE